MPNFSVDNLSHESSLPTFQLNGYPNDSAVSFLPRFASQNAETLSPSRLTLSCDIPINNNNNHSSSNHLTPQYRLPSQNVGQSFAFDEDLKHFQQECSNNDINGVVNVLSTLLPMNSKKSKISSNLNSISRQTENEKEKENTIQSRPQTLSHTLHQGSLLNFTERSNMSKMNMKQKLKKQKQLRVKQVESVVFEQAHSAFINKNIELSIAILTHVSRAHALSFAVSIQDSDFLRFILDQKCEQSHLFSAITTALSLGHVSLIPMLITELTKNSTDVFLPCDLLNNVLHKIIKGDGDICFPASSPSLKRRALSPHFESSPKSMSANVNMNAPLFSSFQDSFVRPYAFGIDTEITVSSPLSFSQSQPQSQLLSQYHPLHSRTGFAYDRRMELHRSYREHPESPNRSIEVMKRLTDDGIISQCVHYELEPASVETLKLVHTNDYIQYILSTEERLKPISDFDDQDSERELSMGPDTYLNTHTALSARVSASAAVTLAEAIVNGEINNGIALCRPPGHHACIGNTSGFCIFNNVALAARAALKSGNATSNVSYIANSIHKVRKVLIFDWDVHHGNGTQEIFWDDCEVLFISIHRYDGVFFPQTGSPSEIGGQKGLGFTINIGLPCSGCTDTEYAVAFHHIVLPIATEFCPDMVIISAGFDSMLGDPLGEMCVSAHLFAHMTSCLSSIAKGKVLFVLEGGYEADVLSYGVSECAKVLLGIPPKPFRGYREAPFKQVLNAIQSVVSQLVPYWNCLAPLLVHQRLALNTSPDISSEDESEYDKDAEVFCERPSQNNTKPSTAVNPLFVDVEEVEDDTDKKTLSPIVQPDAPASPFVFNSQFANAPLSPLSPFYQTCVTDTTLSDVNGGNANENENIGSFSELSTDDENEDEVLNDQNSFLIDLQQQSTH